MKNQNFIMQNPINLAFLISVSYWIYLILTTRMEITWDATEYEFLGKMLARQGWFEFISTGPHREPFYPALIAFSMWLGKIFGFSYQFIQALIQLCFLFLTQILTLCILRLLKINKFLSALTIFYLGISPALVNSALSLYSEIAIYPFILAGMLLVYKSWFSLTGSRARILLLAIVTGLLFVMMTLNKGAFELITLVFIFLFLISGFFTRDRKIIVNIFLYLAFFFAVFYLLIGSYKSLNKTFNGCYTVTDRGAWALYGVVDLRTRPLTSERLFVALARAPGEGICKFIFGQQKSLYSAEWNPDGPGLKKMKELKESKMSQAEVDNALVEFAKQKILRNPGTYILLSAIEGTKMFFWESTQIGFVTYPAGLNNFFVWVPFKNGLRLVMSLLTLFALVYLGVLLWRKKSDILKKEDPILLLYFFLLFIFSFVGSYSLFCIVTRHILPIAPLYLIIISYIFQKIYFKSSNKRFD